MKKLIHFFVVTIFSVNTFAAYWPQDQEIPIQIESNSPTTGADFRLGVPVTTEYERGRLYYFRDADGNLYQGVFTGGDGRNSQWQQMSLVNEEPSGNTSSAAKPGGGYFSSDTHNNAMGAAITTGVAHAIYQGLIFDSAFRGELNKLSEQTQQNQQATQDNYKKITDGIASQGAAVRAALEEYAKELKTQFKDIAPTATQYTSPFPEFVTSLREIEEILQMNRSTLPRRMAARSWGLHMLRQADAFSTNGDQTEAQAFLKYAEAFADIAVGLDPITGPIRDIYEAFTGKNMITGEELDDWSRGFAILGAVTFGFGSKIARGIKALRNISKMVDGERAVIRAIEIDAHISIRIGVGSAPTSAASYQKMLSDLRQQMTKPMVSDPKLKNYLDRYWRDSARVGNGSTAAAYRWERMTGERVGGKSHSQKLQESVTFFKRWLENNPQTSSQDKKAVEEILKDIYSALEGN
jgi:hypothetical protein